MSDAIIATALTREYGSRERTVRALDNINLTIRRGSVHGLLGPNGAGKTTFCKIVTTVVLPSSGSAVVLGHDVAHFPRTVRPRIGVAFGGDRGLYGRLTVRQNLRYWGALFGLSGRRARERVDALIDEFDLVGRRDQRVETLSRGWKQRVHLARALVGNPELLVLDEPTEGLDPIAADSVRTLIHRLKAEDRTIVMSTHNMSEAERLCDDVTFVASGVVIASGSPSSLISQAGLDRSIDIQDPGSAVVDSLAATEGAIVRRTGPRLSISLRDDRALSRVLGVLLGSGVTAFRVREPSLEEYYRALVGGET